jgi:cell division protein FtsQ
MPIAFVVLLIVVGLGIAATWPGFYPKEVVVSGNHRVGRGEILARAGIAQQTSIWLQNIGAMRRRIEAIPYIATARIGRVPPASIRISVTERLPFAELRSGYAAVLVDRTLRVLEPAPAEDSYPVLELAPGVDLSSGSFVQNRAARELRDAYEAMETHRMVPSALSFDRFAGLVVTLRNGLRLLLGSPSGMDQKIALANAIIAQVAGRQPRVAALDLRAPSAPVLVYR